MVARAADGVGLRPGQGTGGLAHSVRCVAISGKAVRAAFAVATITIGTGTFSDRAKIPAGAAVAVTRGAFGVDFAVATVCQGRGGAAAGAHRGSAFAGGAVGSE